MCASACCARWGMEVSMVWMRKARRGWTMPEADARSMLTMIEERIRPADIRFEHRYALIRVRVMVEDDLAALDPEYRSALRALQPLLWKRGCASIFKSA